MSLNFGRATFNVALLLIEHGLCLSMTLSKPMDINIASEGMPFISGEIMSYNKQSEDEPISTDLDIIHLLQYNGPSFMQQNPITNGVTLLDYRNTDENERNISLLLSSQGIPFQIERPKYGWTGTRIRMIVTVPRSKLQQAEAILSAAAQSLVVDVVEGTEGLFTR